MKSIHEFLFLHERIKENPDYLKSKSPDELSEIRQGIESYLTPLGGVGLAFAGTSIEANKEKLLSMLIHIKEIVFERDADAKVWEPGSLGINLGSKIVLSNGEGKRTNFFRVIDALYELKYFQDENGGAVRRDELMKALGNLFNADFSSAASLLSGSNLKTSQDAATKIFDDLKAKAVQKHEEAQEKRDKKEEKRNK